MTCLSLTVFLPALIYLYVYGCKFNEFIMFGIDLQIVKTVLVFYVNVNVADKELIA
jgi:hypothetical protein